MKAYAPIHCRTYYSLLEGILSPHEVCRAARSMGSSSVGISDINNFYGLIEFARTALDMGLKPLYGTALYVKERYLCTLMCLNREGFARANRILTRLYHDTTGTYDPVSDLASSGWLGLAVVSSDPEVLLRLKGRDRKNLYAGLFYGHPFASFVRWSRDNKIPVMALNDGVYLSVEDAGYYRLIRAIKKRRPLSLLSGEALKPGDRLVSGTDMAAWFSAVPEALAAARRYAEVSEGFVFPKGFIFPPFNGLNKRAAAERLYSLCRQGMIRRYGGIFKPGSPGGRRVAYELSIITEKGFTEYFLVVHDVVKRFPGTCGRGSAASSIVSYLLGITHVDPLKYDLFFERFLNRERQDPPDIDVDFPWDEREKVLSYVFEKYRGFSGMVADHITFGIRSALRESATAFGISDREIDTYYTLWMRGEREKIPGDVQRYALKLLGKPRHIGTHPGGVVITPEPITVYTTVQPSALNRPVIAWEKDGTEEAGLVKIDLLGNRSLGVLRDSIAVINKRYSTSLEWDLFTPQGDPETEKEIARGDTLGVFYIESPATRQLLKKMGTGDYEHLVIASSIIRPAASGCIHDYVKRLKGQKFTPYPEPAGSILSDNLGVMVYQEDVARIAHGVAGFSYGEADSLRKLLSKRNREERLKKVEKKFRSGARKNGFSKDTIDLLWSGILSFEGYSFSKAHSASYALVSFKLAWVKNRYPIVFYTSVINNGGGYYDRQVYIDAVRRMGFSVLPADINRSMIRYTCTENTLVTGLGQLKGISEACLEKIINERERKGVFRDIFEFYDRVDPVFESVRILARSGVLDSIADSYTRPQLLWLFYVRNKESSLFVEKPRIPESVGDYSDAVKLTDEIRTLGIIIRRHPLEIFRERIDRLSKNLGGYPVVDSRDLDRWAGKEVYIPGILVTAKGIKTKNRREMSFISFEDSYGIFETVMFPRSYSRERWKLYSGAAFFIFGRVENDFGALQIQVKELLALNKSNKYASLSR